MTRVNVVPVEELPRSTLLEECRCIPRVIRYVRDAQSAGKTPAMVGIPSQYVLDGGHARFFYDKCLWLVRRQQLVLAELQVNHAWAEEALTVPPSTLIAGLEPHWLNDWEPPDVALYLNRLYLRERQAKYGRR